MKLEDLKPLVLDVLRNTSPGKSDPPIRHFVTAYQILNRLPAEVREEIQRNVGPSGEGCNANFSGAKRIAQVAEHLIQDGVVELTYMDARGVQFYIEGEGLISPGYSVCGLYRSIV